MKKHYERGLEEWIKAINEILSKIDDTWILWNICRFAIGMTK